MHFINQRLIGDSGPMREIKSYILRIAQTDVTVLITGDTGTGKDLVAECIHRQSERRHKPMVCIDCTSLPETLVESELFGHERGAFTGATCSRAGKFEQAAGGTVFLDEIGDMPLTSQSKLLRVIDKKVASRVGGKRAIPLDVRIIAATNQAIEKDVDEGRFRMDLYYRLNVARLNIPPLKDRIQDLRALIQHFIPELNQKYHNAIIGFSEDDITLLSRYQWPGNVRELKNIVETAFINHTGSSEAVLFLPGFIRKKLMNNQKDNGLERHNIVAALIDNNWNKAKTARQLNWSRMTMYRKIKKFNIVEKRIPDR